MVAAALLLCTTMVDTDSVLYRKNVVCIRLRTRKLLLLASSSSSSSFARLALATFVEEIFRSIHTLSRYLQHVPLFFAFFCILVLDAHFDNG